MSIVWWLLIVLSILLGGVGLIAFFWSLRSGQYDDLEGAAERILFDDGEQGDTPAGRPPKR